MAGILFTVGGVASPDGEECQRLFECWGFIAVFMGVNDSCVHQAVTNMGVVLHALYRSSPHCDTLPDQVARAAKAFQKAAAPTSKGSYLYMLEHDFLEVLRALRGVGLGMYWNDVTESVNALMKQIYIRFTNRGSGIAASKEYAALRQTLQYLFMLHHSHIVAHGKPRPSMCVNAVLLNDE